MPTEMALAGLKARSHPLRAALSEEMHIRKLPGFKAPAQLLQLVTLIDSADIEKCIAVAKSLCNGGPSGFDTKTRYFTCSLDGFEFAWERHTEFITYTFIANRTGAAWFDPARFSGPMTRLGQIPGSIIRATQIRFLEQEAPAPSDADLEKCFSADDLVVCDVDDGRARIWSDFRLHADGFGRLLIADRGLVRNEYPNLVQRLQELGNYRKMALLGLPVAQRLAADVTGLERKLAAVTAQVAQGGMADDALLAELSFLSAELARIMAETRYRMSASRAYAELSTDRVKQLRSQSVSGYQSLTEFTERRLLPAIRTCNAFSARVEDLSQRAAWTSALLRTRVDTALAKQNVALLASMNRRTDLQLRLQQAVEGLSIAAISYYFVGLFGYLVKSVHTVMPSFNPDIVVGASVPFVIPVVWLAMRRLKAGLAR